MYTAKQAILLKDHVPDSQSYIFYIDIRTPGKGYEEFYKKAQRDAGAIYIVCSFPGQPSVVPGGGSGPEGGGQRAGQDAQYASR